MAQTDQKNKKFPLRTVLLVLVIAAVWLGGYLAVSHYFGSFPLDSADDLVNALAQANQAETVTILSQAQHDDLHAVLFDPGTPEDRTDDGLALFVPDPLFRTRWCYADAMPQDAAAPLTLYTKIDRHAGSEPDGSALCIIFGTGVPETVTGCTLTWDGVPSGEPVAVSGSSVLQLTTRDVTEDRFALEIHTRA